MREIQQWALDITGGWGGEVGIGIEIRAFRNINPRLIDTGYHEILPAVSVGHKYCGKDTAIALGISC